MADDFKARPVSGEIMTAARSGGDMPREAPAGDIVDAEFETVAPGKPPRPAKAPEPAPIIVAEAPPVQGMDTLRRAETPGRAPQGGRGGPAFWIVGFATVALAFWVSGGHALLMPRGMAVPVSTQRSQLRIANVETRVDRAGTRVMLFVDGEAVNDGAEPAPLPPIEIRVTDPGGRVTLYNLGTAAREVAPGGRFSFSSRLGIPKNGVKSVSVEFKGQHDATGSGQGH
jgi:hypothetical protein